MARYIMATLFAIGVYGACAFMTAMTSLAPFS